MPPEQTSSPNSTPSSSTPGAEQTKIPPELVQEIADRVYQMFLQDLKIERERNRLGFEPLSKKSGGW
jgi:hypothetical protein